MTARRCIAAALAAALVCGSAGCSSDPTRGYSFRSTYGENVRTVAIPVWDNQSFAYGLEVHLTDALIKEIQRTTPWVVTSADNAAQTTLTGAITDATLRQLTTSSATGLVQEMAVEVVVDFEWRDARSGRVLVSRRNFRAMESFVPARPTSERLELGQHAAVQEIARAIVAELRSNW